jgi:hypothetical protein
MDALSASIVNYASTQSEASLRTAVATSVLKTAMEVQAQTAQALLQAIPQAGGNALDGRGALIDVYA